MLAGKRRKTERCLLVPGGGGVAAGRGGGESPGMTSGGGEAAPAGTGAGGRAGSIGCRDTHHIGTGLAAGIAAYGDGPV